jgi:hypothetical protein
VEDKHDLSIPEPMQHFFDANSSPHIKEKKEEKGSILQNNPYKDEPFLDTKLSPFVPTEPRDPYCGKSLLRLSHHHDKIDERIPFYPRRAKEDYNNLRYPGEYSPPEQAYEVELPTRERKTEPAKDPVPRVKGIGGSMPQTRKSERLARNNGTAKPTTDCEKKKPKKRKLKTIWTPPSKLAAIITTVLLLGANLIPNTVLAEPNQEMQDFGTDCLFPDVTSLQPLVTTDKMESLRVYHAHLDILNEIESPDPARSDWDALYIEEYNNQGNATKPDLWFKVNWINGDKTWVRMKDLRLHDPLLVLRYGLRNKMTLKPGWEWVESFVNSDQQLTSIIQAYKVSKSTTFKFGIQVPKSTRDALRLDSQEEAKLWHDAIEAELKQINDYETFRVLEEYEQTPPGYKMIPYHCIYDVKFDGR